MSKRKTGEFDMTPSEWALFNENIVQERLSIHYQQMADAHIETFVRAREKFWNEVKRRDLPVHCTMSVHTGDRKLTIVKTNEERAQRTVKTPAKKEEPPRKRRKVQPKSEKKKRRK